MQLRRYHTKPSRRLLWASLSGLLLLAGCATTGNVSDTAKSEGLVWPLPPERPRVAFVQSISSDRDVGASKSRSDRLKDSLLGKTEKARQLNKPYGVYVDKQGRIFVADTGLGKLVVFDFQDKKFSLWGEDGSGMLAKPVSVTADSSGKVYVTDVQLRRVVVYDRDGNFVAAIGKKGQLEAPAGIAVNEEIGRIYVADVKKHHIAVFDMAGALVSTIGKRGKEPGQFNFPTNMTLDREGKLYVVDSMNFRVQILDPEGKVLKTFGNVGNGLGQFARPKGIAVDSDGNIYVVDAAFSNFQIFDSDGRLLLFVGSMGKKPGQFWLPAGAYIDGQDRIYVADQYNFRVQVFQYLKDGEQAQHPPEQDRRKTSRLGAIKKGVIH